MHLLRLPLFRLLAINLGIGSGVAVLSVGGLLALNPLNLRDLIFADRDGSMVVMLLVFDFVITLGSAAMGTAIMVLGRGSEDDTSADRV